MAFTRRRFSPFVIGLSVTALMVTSAVTAGAQAQPGPGQSPTSEATKKPRLIVKWKESQVRTQGAGAQQAATTSLARRSLAHVATTGAHAAVFQAKRSMSAPEVDELRRELSRNPAVEYVDVDLPMKVTATPNDARFAEQWDLQSGVGSVNVPTDWWKIDGALGGRGGEGSVVGVIDTGITSHSDLDSAVVGGYDFMSDAYDARDGDGRDANYRDEGDWGEIGDCSSTAYPSTWHGTHVAGTIAAQANNGKGIVGIAPRSKIVVARSLGLCGGMGSDIMDGMMWLAGLKVPGTPAVPAKADVINLSLGGKHPSCPRSWQDAIDKTVAAGTTVVVAAGNNTEDASTFVPGNCRNVIVVGATDRTGSIAPYSNYGSRVTLAAPGGNKANGQILSTINLGKKRPAGEGYAAYQGTSMATPHVSALVALMASKAKSKGTALTPDRVRTLLVGSTRKANCPQGCGAGMIDISKTLAAMDR